MNESMNLETTRDERIWERKTPTL